MLWKQIDSKECKQNNLYYDIMNKPVPSLFSILFINSPMFWIHLFLKQRIWAEKFICMLGSVMLDVSVLFI